MEKFKVSFEANNQQLKSLGTKHASDTYADIEATFILGEKWTDMDSVSAVWWNDFTRIATVLDSQGKCIVPHEVLARKGCVRVNLVGSIVEGDELITRLTSYSAEAVQVNEKIKLTGSETSEVTPSQFEQFVTEVKADADRAETVRDEAEAARDVAVSAKDTAVNAVEGFEDIVDTATATAVQTIQGEGATQVTAIQTEGTTQVASVRTEGSTQVTAVQDKGDEVLDSIPADYTQLSQNVTDLKSDFAQYGTYNLMPSEVHFNEWYQLNGQGAQAYNGWCWFKVDNPNRDVVANHRYGVYRWNGIAYEELTVYCYWTFNDSQHNAGANAKLSGTPFSQNMVALYISISMATLAQGVVVCDIDNISKISQSNYPHKSLLNKNNVIESLDVCEISSIENPYIYLDEHDNITLKFDTINYTFNDADVEFTTADLPSAIFTSWTYDYAFKYDVYRFALSAGQKLILSPYKHTMYKASAKEADADIVMVYVEDDVLRGEFVDAYNQSVKDSKDRTLWDSLTNDMVEAIDSKEDSVVGLCDIDKFVFSYVSDDHATGWLNRYRKYTAMALDRVSKSLGVDAILNCGDSVLSAGGALNALRKQFESTNKEDVLFVEGNHDRYIVDPILSKEDFFNFMYRKQTGDTSFHFGNPPASYYYRDFADKKIRIVVLDLYDIPSQYNYNDHNGYRQDQLQWLANEALRIDADWSVIVATHSAPYSDADGMTNNTGGQGNRELLPQILSAFKNGTSVHLVNTTVLDNVFTVDFTADFTGQGARTLIGVFTGHNHTDVILEKNGITYVSIACGYIDINLYRGQLGYRYQDEYSAIAFDVVIVDTTSNTVTLKRFGWGSDRSFSY